MNDFNINPDYKKYRQKQKNKAAKLHKLKVFVAVFSVILIAASVISVLAVSGVFEKAKEPSATQVPKTTPSESGNAGTKAPETTSKNGVTVFIDPGHGYFKNGTFDGGIGNGSAYYDISGGKTESVLTLEIAMKLRDILKENGYNVVMFREDIIESSISDGYSSIIANDRFADVFVSIHGKSGMPAERGATMIYSSKHKNSKDCKAFAEAVAAAIDLTSGSVSADKVDVETWEPPGFDTLNMPAIEVEVLNLSNEKDAKLAVSESWQERFASALAQGIMSAFPLEQD